VNFTCTKRSSSRQYATQSYSNIKQPLLPVIDTHLQRKGSYARLTLSFSHLKPHVGRSTPIQRTHWSHNGFIYLISSNETDNMYARYSSSLKTRWRKCDFL